MGQSVVGSGLCKEIVGKSVYGWRNGSRRMEIFTRLYTVSLFDSLLCFWYTSLVDKEEAL